MAFTYFFRDLQTLEKILTHWIPFISGRSVIKIWDAGCAMGPEPYSLAILLAERMHPYAFKNVRIIATDIDESGNFGQIIHDGIYPEDTVKRIPQPLLQKYFLASGGQYQLVDAIRNRVHYQRHDLLTLHPVGEEFSLVLCKNVLLHFSPEERVQVLRMFHHSLAMGGLFASEQTQKMPQQLQNHFEPLALDAQIHRKV